MSTWTLRLLGDCRLLAPSGEEVKLATRKSLALLALAALEGESGLSRQAAGGLLWPGSDGEQARLHVRKALWTVRSACAAAAPRSEPPILVGGEQLRLAPHVHVDATAFVHAAQAARNDIHSLELAANLFTGEVLGDFAIRNAPDFDDWARRERQRFRELACDVLLRMARALAEAGRRSEAIGTAERLVALDPLAEAGHQLLMELHWREGRSSAALRQFRELEAVLRRELDVTPDFTTEQLRTRIEEDRTTVRPPASQVAQPLPPPDAPELAPVPPVHTKARRRPLLIGAGMAVLAATAAAAAQYGVDHAGDPPRIASIFPIVPGVPVTGSPALSGDGSRVVFAGRAPDGSQSLFAVTIGAREPIRLTNGRGIPDHPSWSPDGTSIAFSLAAQNGSEACRIMVMTVPGGVEREIARCRGLASSAPSWTTDGRSIIFADADDVGGTTRLAEVSVVTGTRHYLTRPRPDIAGDRQPAASPDGSSVAFLRATSPDTAELMLLDRASGAVTQLTGDGASIGGLAFSRDGKGVLFASDRGGDAGLWWVPLTGGTPQRLSEGLLRYRTLSSASAGGRLVFEGIRDRSQIMPASALKPAFEGEFREWAPDVAPDGTVLFVSTRGGGQQLWAQHGREAPRLLTQGAGRHIGGPRWSPDGQAIAFVDARGGVPDLYVTDRSGRSPRQLTNDLAEERSPQWSADGRFILYVSRAGGRFGLWRADSSGRARPAQLASGPLDIRIGPGGKAIYYRLPGRAGLFRRQLDSSGNLRGSSERVAALPKMPGTLAWEIGGEGLVMVDRWAAGEPVLRRVDLATGRSSVLGHASALHQRTPFALGPGGVYLTRQSFKVELYGINLD